MNCDEFVELVTAYLEGTLDEATGARFTAHMAECDGCDVYLEQFRETIGMLGRLPSESLTSPARERMLDAFRTWHHH
jgi:anti-sigma factor RsiW